MRTIDELKRIPLGIPGDRDGITKAEHAKLRDFYVRLGRLCEEMPGKVLVSEAARTAKTWRSAMAWRWFRALGLR